MKRKNNLYPIVCDRETIRKAIHKASLGKRNRKIVRKILADEETYIDEIQSMLVNKTYVPSDFTEEIIYDGIRKKERVISKPKFYPDQVIHWAIYLCLKDWIYPSFYEFSCGSIPNRGIHYGKKHISKWVYQDRKNTKYYLQLDITKFYPSIKVDILMDKLRKKIKDEDFLELVELTLSKSDSLLIGMLLSQVFANFFLNDFDHWLKQEKKVKYYARYMDDMVIFGSNKRALRKLKDDIDVELEKIGLKLKGNWQIRKTDVEPLDFMGYRFFRNRTIMRKSIMLRISRRVAKVYKKGKPTLHDAYAIISYMGWIKSTATKRFFDIWIKPYVKFYQLKDMIRSFSKNGYLQHNRRQLSTGMG